jgi:periplasmic protein TonB
MRKSTTADLRHQYPLNAQFGMILALSVVILAFRADLHSSSDVHLVADDRENIVLDEIQPTRHIEQKPPPPRPTIPVAVSDNSILDADVPVIDMTLDFETPLPLARMPPPVDAPAADEGPEIFEIVEEEPMLIGGLASLQHLIRYPEVARRAGLEGRVFVQFIVDDQGNVVDPVVVRGLGGGLDEEALRAVSQAKFTPGKQRGQAVHVRMSIPITFRLR